MTIKNALDAVDRKLLRLVQENARRPTAALAKDLGLSRTAVQARLARLERDRVIVGYSAVVATPGGEGLMAMVSLRLGVRPCRLVLDQLRTWPEIAQGYSVSGSVDAFLIVKVASPAELSALADRLQAVNGVDEVETAVILDTFSDRTAGDKPSFSG